MKTSHDDAAIERIAHGLLDRSLPKPEWTHAAHFAAALWVLRHRPGTDMPATIRAYNVATGVRNGDTTGYHHTITCASMRMAAAMLAACPPAMPLSQVLAALLASPCGRADWLLAHWSHARLFSVAARRGWVAPDLSPLAGPEPLTPHSPDSLAPS